MKNNIVGILFGVLFISIPVWAYQEIVVDLSIQKAYAIEDGHIVFEGRISSGKKGRETPNGTYTIMQKKRMHRSNLWPKPKGGAKMPYMMRLTNSGIAMHLGYVPNRPASHGCIRMKNGFAQKMYRWARVGTKVVVEGRGEDYMDALKFAKDYYGDEYAVIDYHD
ncbi:MAG TPA: L,D-transpeptidase [Epsilonproteobacteria bacterium]|nr:L,D-transpeptidase [Campylobacterota bacterium]